MFNSKKIIDLQEELWRMKFELLFVKCKLSSVIEAQQKLIDYLGVVNKEYITKATNPFTGKTRSVIKTKFVKGKKK